MFANSSFEYMSENFEYLKNNQISLPKISITKMHDMVIIMFLRIH